MPSRLPSKKDREGHALKIFNALLDGPATCEEMEERLSLLHQSASARCSDLQKSGCVRPTGETRPTVSGGTADVLERIPGATFERHEAWERSRRSGPSTAPYLDAGRAYAKARHDKQTPEEWAPLARSVLEEAVKAFPFG